MRKEKLEELKSLIEEYKKIKEEKLENNSFITVEKKLYTLKNGKTIIRENILKNNKDGNAVIILPITKENNTILVVEPRVLTKNSVGVGLPAGYIEDNENIYDAALRELKEETGYVSNNIKEICSFYQDEGCSKAYNHSLIAFDCEKKYQQNLDKDEYIKYFECTYEEALELVELGYINGVNSMLTLEKSKQYIKRR